MYDIQVLPISQVRKHRKNFKHFEMDPTEWGYTPVSVNNRNDIILSAKEEANKQKDICIALMRDSNGNLSALSCKDRKGTLNFILFNAKRTYLSGISVRIFKVKKLYSGWLTYKVAYKKGNVLLSL